MWSKIILPLLALAILSSLFLFSKSYDPGDGIRLLQRNLAEFALKERITSPEFAGMTPDGVAIQISAKEASPRITGGPAFDATDLTARIEMPDGAIIDVIASIGSIDSLAKTAELSGGINLKSSLGMTAQTEGLFFKLDKLDIQSQGEVTAQGALGTIHAGELHLTLEEPENPEDEPGYVLSFKNGVKLVYTPETK